MHNLDNLLIWKKAIYLAEEVYVLVADFPAEDKFGIIAQIKRCAVSIPSNIAEGAGRNSKKEFKHFLAISNGSSYELQTQLILAEKFNYINQKQLENILLKITELQ